MGVLFKMFVVRFFFSIFYLLHGQTMTWWEEAILFVFAIILIFIDELLEKK